MDCLALKDLNTKKLRLELPENEGRNAQKENIFFDLSRLTPKTPMKNETMPIDLSKQKGCTPERNPVTPNPPAEVPLSDPWTPTANLKMLISAASPDIRDREKKKELFRPIENDRKEDCLCDAYQFDVTDDSATDDFEKQRPSRKQKSLGLLCQKFLARYPSHPLSTEKTTISLDEVASSLSVERRRIYDIVNVLESLRLVSRVAKNQYCWHGLQNLDQTLEILQRQGQEQRYEEQMVNMQQKETDAEMKSGDSKKDNATDSQFKEYIDISDGDFTSVSANSRKDKSLRIMSQKFVMLFLVSKTKTVTLDVAAKILIEEGQDVADHSKFKTKVRRLYDIANVLTSLALIKKVHVTEERGRKPAFKWIGPANFKNSSNGPWVVVPTPTTVPTSKQLTETSPSLNRKKRLSRHASFISMQPPEGDTRKVNSAPSSPQRGLKAWTADSGNYCKKMVHLAAVSRLQFDDDEITKPTGAQKTNSSMENGLSTAPVHCIPGTSISSSCVKALPPSLLPMRHLDVTRILLPNGANGHVAVLSPSGVSKTEEGQPALLAGQPVYFPPTSVVMLCGNVQSSTGDEVFVQRSENKIHQEQAALQAEEKNTSSLSFCDPKKQTVNKNVSLLPQEREEPAAKRIKGTLSESSITVEQSKVSPKQPEQHLNNNGCTSPAHPDQETWSKLDSELICMEEDIGKDTSIITANDQRKAELLSERSEHAVTGEQLPQGNSEQLPLTQYFYLPSAAGLNGLNLLLPSNQNHGALTVSPSRFASVSVPYVVVPSTSLAAFPVLCPTTMHSAINTTSSPIPNTSSVNFSFPSLVPPGHLLIGTQAVVPLKTSECSSADQDFSPVHLSPVLGCSPTTVKPVSPTCGSQPVVTLKLHQQSPTPLTPKSDHSPQHETFFQTPGNRSSGPVSGHQRDGRQIRTAGSAQRRLEISSSTLDYSP